MDSKRPFPNESIDTSPAKCMKTQSAPPTSSNAKSTKHLMVQALGIGVFPFLTIRDSAILLNCCKAFRNDSELAKSALRVGTAGTFTSHFFHDCKMDLFSFNPTRFPNESLRDSYRCGHEADEKTSDHGDSSKPDGKTERPQANAQLVSLAAAFENIILAAHPRSGQCVSSYGDPVCAVPITISLWEHHPDKHTLQPDHVWTREEVRVALNAISKGFGDQFTADDPAKVRGSEFGAHWENIKMNENGEVTCMFCEKWKDKKLRKELLPFPNGGAWKNVELSEAISGSYGFRKVCTAYAQPLKRSLLKSFKFVNRIKYPRLGMDYNNTCWADVDVELLAGMSSSGFLCGSLFVRYENP